MHIVTSVRVIAYTQKTGKDIHTKHRESILSGLDAQVAPVYKQNLPLP